MTHLRILALLLAAALAGCATPMASRDVKIAPDSKNGLVVASFTNGWMGFVSGVTWRYRSLDSSGREGSIVVSKKGLDAIRGADQALFAFELPPGDYEFYSWTENTTYGSYYASVQPFEIRFHSYAGRTTYLGNLELISDFKDLKHFQLDVKDFAPYDVPLFLAHYPNVPPEQVQIALMHSAKIPAPAVTDYAAPTTRPSLTLPALPEPADAPGVRNVRLASAESTDQKGFVVGLASSDKPHDAAVVQRSFANGVVTYTGQAGFGRGSGWAAIGIAWTVDKDLAADASSLRTVTFRVASTARNVRVALEGAGQDPKCYPVKDLEVSATLHDYTLPISSFAPLGRCKPEDAKPLERIVGFQLFAGGPADGKVVVLGVGTTTLRP